jgi:predicted ATP-dependent endonuclease of OLD family
LANGEVLAELDADRFLIQVNGAGIREALRLILDYEFERPEILLVEEPEIHLHPALETSMMRYLKSVSTESQIFITTHSTNFLDTAEMRNVYLVSRKESTSIQSIDANEAESSIPAELGIRLSSLFMFDRLVFVEGASDEEVVREWASILNVNLGNAGVGFIPMGGVRNLSHFAADKTISFLTKRRVKMWFVIDRDEREEQEVQSLSKTLGAQARLIVLGRREIENYLIVPRAIADLIVQKKKQAGERSPSVPSLADVEKAISESADQLRMSPLRIG